MPKSSPPESAALTRRGLTGLFAAGLALAAAGLSAARALAGPLASAPGLAESEVTFAAPGGPVPAYLARPNGRGPYPGVVVVSDRDGVSSQIRDVCRRFARLGYAAIAPVLLEVEIGAGNRSAVSNVVTAPVHLGGAFSDRRALDAVGAAAAFLKAQDGVIGDRMAITGFGWGGSIVWLACETFSDFRAGVAWNGPLAPAADAAPDPARLWPIQNAASLRAPVLGLYAGGDPLTAAVPAMRQALEAAGQSGSQIIIYPDAQAGFFAPDDPPNYDAADAEDGWMRLLAHFAINGAVSRHDPPNHSSRTKSAKGARGRARVKRSGRSARPARHRRKS